MLHKILMPKLGLTMNEGQLAQWMVPVGSSFRAEQGLFVVETDKVATEVAAEGDGRLTEITVPAGQTVAVGAVVGYWQDDAAGRDQPTPLIPAAAAGPRLATGSAGTSGAPGAAGACGTTETSSRIPVTPLARRLAHQLGVDLAAVKGSGPRQRIKAADVQAAVASPSGPAQPTMQVARQVAPAVVPAQTLATGNTSRIKPGPVQAAMARRLTAVKQQVPHFYLAVETKVSALLKLRAELNALEQPVRFTLNHFIVAAVGRALRDMPQANRVWEDGDIVSLVGSDVGVAVNTQRGLFVPVLRDAGGISLTEVARRARIQADRARSGALTADDMSGGAVTVSNAGMFNVKFMTPIINPGQSMILGVGSVERIFRPDGEGKPVLHEEIGLVLACDHRLMDGVSGLGFLNRVAVYLEQPMRLLVGD